MKEHEEHAKTHDNKTHVHEGMKHESLKVSNFESQPRKVRVSFSKISKEQFRKVVRGRDAELFEAFFQDALRAGWAKDCEVDRIRMAGLFHQVHRINQASIPGAVINKQWRLRDSTGNDENDVPLGLHLSEEDEHFATLLIRPAVEIPANSQPAVAMKAHAVDVDLSPEELRRQAMVREANISAFRAMTRPTVHS